MLPILKEAAQRAGGLTALAEGIGLSRSAVYQWRGRIPAERVPAISNVTGIPKSRLRPDLYPDEEKPRKKRRR
jgi:DNA-binding transcriptional regulator YdaS (Cro superfamily)